MLTSVFIEYINLCEGANGNGHMCWILCIVLMRRQNWGTEEPYLALQIVLGNVNQCFHASVSHWPKIDQNQNTAAEQAAEIEMLRIFSCHFLFTIYIFLSLSVMVSFTWKRPESLPVSHSHESSDIFMNTKWRVAVVSAIWEEEGLAYIRRSPIFSFAAQGSRN